MNSLKVYSQSLTAASKSLLFGSVFLTKVSMVQFPLGVDTFQLCLTKFKLIQALKHVMVICKYQKDRIKNNFE